MTHMPMSLLVAFAIILAIAVKLASGQNSLMNFHTYDSLELYIVAPPTLVGVRGKNITYSPAEFGNPIINPPGQLAREIEVVQAWPDFTACTDLRGKDGIARTMDGRPFTGLMMLVLRGDCTFGQKSAMAQLAGAEMVLLYSCSPFAPSLCDPGRVDLFSGNLNVTIPTLMISYWDGQNLVNGFAEGCIRVNNCSIIVSIPGTSAIHPDDRLALNKMAEDIDFSYIANRVGQSGPLPNFSMIRNTSWDPCLNRIAGIWCQGDPGRIVILDLEAFNLTGILSPAFGELTALQQLVLSSNNFFCTSLPCSFVNLTSLKVLSLFHMGLQSFEPEGQDGCLANWSQLEYLDASFNKIEELSVSMLNWTSLQSLSVANNQIITQLDSKAFHTFAQLSYLDLSNNYIFLDITGLTFTHMTNLAVFNIGSNLFQGELRQDAFDRLQVLSVCDLSQNHLTGRLPNFLLTNSLTKIDLSGNNFEGNCSTWEMQNLLYLSLGDNLLSEPQENMPTHMQSLLFLDLSNNFLTMPPSYDDVGEFLFATVPLSVETVHFENNSIQGTWGTGFLQSYPQLSHLYLSHNKLQALPDDIFSIGESTIIDLDISFNELSGSLPSVPPPPATTNIKFNGNPNFFDPQRQLPSWIQLDPAGGGFLPTANSTYTCRNTIGVNYHLSVILDPSYYGYDGCRCNRGTYGEAPVCPDIPASLEEPYNTETGQGTFTDALFGSQRFFQGIDTSFVLGMHNLSLGPVSMDVNHVKSPRRVFLMKGEITGTNEGVFVVPGPEPESAGEEDEVGEDMHDSSDATSLPPTPPAPLPLVRAIYITFSLNLDEFSGADDSIAVYEGGLDLRGDRVTLWTGTDAEFNTNIDLQGMYPPMTVTILGGTGVVNFRSRHAEGTHFHANFTLSQECPPGYLVYSDTVNPDGLCRIPPGPSASTSIIMLLVTSVIIGILALCLLGQKMSTIQGLLNGTSLSTAHHRSRREQAQEIYGPVLTVEDSWRRQLKRDMVKEGLMLGLELAGYISNWIVVIQEVRNHAGPVLSDSFVVGYCIVVVCSTVTGFVSVFTRVRVIREIHHELQVGLAVVPTIDMLLNQMKRGKNHHHHHGGEGHNGQQGGRSSSGAGSSGGGSGNRTANTGGTPSHPPQPSRSERERERNGRRKRTFSTSADEEDDLSASLGPKDRKAATLAGYGRPLLGDSPVVDSLVDNILLSSGGGSSAPRDQVALNVDAERSFDRSNAAHQHTPRGKSGSIASVRSASPAPSVSGGGIASASSEELKVRLSSKDPNVQLAWVQRSISTTKLTSFNLIFSTIPFLVLNQVRIFLHNQISSDWALQLSSLFASMLLGVKLLRILALGELLQRRNELVFEVIVYGSGSIPKEKQFDRGRSDRGGGVGDRDASGMHTPGMNNGGRGGGGGQDSLPHSSSNVSHYGAQPTNQYHGPQSPIPEDVSQRLTPRFSAGPVGSSTLSDFVSSQNNGEDFLGNSSNGGHGGADPASANLLAPATSLASNGFSSSTGGQSHLFSAPANFDTTAQYNSHHLDEASVWARSNHGSVLQLQPMESPPSVILATGFGSGVIPSAAAQISPQSQSNFNSIAEESRSTSRSDATSSSGSSWIQSHMMADDASRNNRDSPSATRMKRLSAGHNSHL